MTSHVTTPTTLTPDEASKRAVAYYRSSVVESEEAIESQRQQVRGWAEKNGIEIIREFVDAGTSGLPTERRPAFDELMELVKEDHDFRYILCQDVSRWGRFQGSRAVRSERVVFMVI